jgi:Alpha-L-arabinofuranosidase B, catalytic
MALGLAGLFGGSASAAGQPVLHTKAAALSTGSAKVAAQPTPHTKAAWQADIGHVRQPGRGCYHASYPALTWHAVKCVTAPRIPDALGLVSEPLKDARPETVGANTDESAQVPGLISSATGTFQDVTPGITEAGQIDDAGSQVPNAFSLQLNSQRYINTNECGDSTEPANCRAAQQFIYRYNDSSGGLIYMEYWLVNYTTIAIDCPPSWTFFKGTSTSAPGCYMDSPYVSVPVLTASQLADVALTGSATSVDDEVTLALASGTATSVSNTDSALDLAANWDTTEWNVFGDGNGGQANFDANTSLEPVTTLTDTSGSAAPSCSELGLTAETNNLNLTNTPELGGESSPTAAFQETDDGTPVTEGLPCQTVGGTTASGSSVCAIYASDDTPCVAAYSMDRALYSNYDGPLYQVKRASDGTTANIGLLDTGGDVNASEQDSFCADTACTITEIYDQSSEGNNLTIEGAGGNGAADSGAAANALPITIDGNEAYGLDITPGVGYRDDSTQGMAYDDEPSGTYMVASGTNVNSGCCFDFGNAEANNDDNGDGHMDAVNLTTFCGSYDAPCSGSGPWVEADMENGQYLSGDGSNPADTGNSSDFVTAMLANNGQTTFELEGGNGQSGGLTTYWDGPLPTGYSPMDQEGAIVLGTGGDNSHSDIGSFFEGVITSNVPDQAAENAVQANIVDADYAGSSNPVSTAVASAAGQAVVHAAGATGAGASGYSSVYTVNSANGDLQETYLPYMGQPWATQDLSAKYGTPAVMPGTEPVSIVHCGYTSVYTVDASSGDLQETYLPAIGDAWATQDLSAKYGTPPTNVTPTAVVHNAGAADASPGCGYISVYTRDRNGGLQETYLSDVGFPGDPWATQDLSAKYGTPGVLSGTSPVAIVHCGYTSVYTVDENHQLQETYLAAIGDAWSTQNLSANYSTPDTTTTPTAVVHIAGASGATPGCGFTSVYTVDEGSDDLQETYLPVAGFPGDAWNTQNLSANYGTPPVAPGTQPEALVHMNYTSVYTVDEGSDDLQETYLASIGDPWGTQNLSTKYGTPTTDQSPIVLLHPDASGNFDWTSVYTVDEFGDDLQETYLSNVGFPGDPWATQDLSAKYGTPEVTVPESPTAGWSLVHSGYTSVYTSDASNGDLQETYLPAMDDPWTTQDLSTKYGTPAVMAGTTPVSVTHDGYTSVYTIDTNGDLQETYLPAIGDAWATQDLSAKYGTPASDVTPTAVFHDGYTSVYTIDESSGDLQETYLPGAGFPGDSWVTQNLSVNYGTPAVDPLTSPVALVHDGSTSVYTVDESSDDLQETYLPAIGDPWATQDLSTKYGTPAVASDSQPVALYHDGYTSVYTVDESGDDLQETYLAAIGNAWGTQNLSTKYGTPPAYGSATALVHPDTSGGLTWTSVYTLEVNGDLQETYLPDTGFPGDSWITQNLSANYGTPAAQKGT